MPLDVANHVQERLGKEVERLRGEMVKSEVDMQEQMHKMQREANEANKERIEALASIKNIKERLND